MTNLMCNDLTHSSYSFAEVLPSLVSYSQNEYGRLWISQRRGERCILEPGTCNENNEYSRKSQTPEIQFERLKTHKNTCLLEMCMVLRIIRNIHKIDTKKKENKNLRLFFKH